ncbi:MAG: hypothetical protein ACYS8X_07545, partial [Planctomycetota bacterium]
ADSPYDIARRNHPDHRVLSPAEQEDLRREWTDVAAPRLREQLRTGLELANEELADCAGVTYVDVREFARSVHFQPVSTPITDERGVPTPATARKDWVDRFALAQQMSCRVELGRPRLVDVDLSSGQPFKAIVDVTLIGTGRHVIAGRPNPIPAPPQGHRYWSPPSDFDRSDYVVDATDLAILRAAFATDLAILRAAFSVFQDVFHDNMPGRPYVAGEDALADEAFALLGNVPVETIRETGRLTVLYCPTLKEWICHGTWDWETIPITAWPKSIEWQHGIAEEDRDKVSRR